MWTQKCLLNVLISSLLQDSLWNYYGACNLVPKFICWFIYLVSYSLAVPRLYCWVWAFSSCGEHGLLSRCGAQVSHCGTFPGGGTRTLEPMDYNSCSIELLLWPSSVAGSPRLLTTGQIVGVHQLSCSEAWGTDLGSNPCLCIGRQILYHSLTRETPLNFLIGVSTLDYIVENSYYKFWKN